MTQEKLGQEVGYTFQQIQKYENGVNRVSTEVLVKLCAVLDQPLSYFIDAAVSGTPDQVEIDQVLSTPEGRDLVQAVRGFSRQNLKSLRDVALAMRGAGA
jgi:transcriptional regulator with XRE-family HTH domain